MGSVEEVHFGSFSWIRMDIALLLSGVLDLAAADPLGLPLEIPLVVRLKIDPCQYPAPSSVTLVKCFHEEVSIPLDAQIQRLMEAFLVDLGLQSHMATPRYPDGAGAGPRLKIPRLEFASELFAECVAVVPRAAGAPHELTLGSAPVRVRGENAETDEAAGGGLLVAMVKYLYRCLTTLASYCKECDSRPVPDPWPKAMPG
eukprot:RCo049410